MTDLVVDFSKGICDMLKKLGEIPLGGFVVIDGAMCKVSMRTPGCIMLSNGNSYSSETKLITVNSSHQQPTWTPDKIGSARIRKPF